MYNKTLKVETLNEVTRELLSLSIDLAMNGEISSVAPLGFSGDNIVLFGDEKGLCPNGKKGRKSLVSIRNYCTSPELLITDINGKFLFYGKFDNCMGFEFICDKFYEIFLSVKDIIETEAIENISLKPTTFKKAQPTVGFAFLGVTKEIADSFVGYLGKDGGCNV